MKIEKNTRGWQITPSTSDEQTALEFLLNAFEEKYTKPVETKDADSASYLHLEAPVQNMGAQG